MISVSGADGGHTIDFRRLAQAGITLVGRAETFKDGTLHFAGDLTRHTTRFHLCNMGITMHDPHRDQGAIASATVIEPNGSRFESHILTANS